MNARVGIIAIKMHVENLFHNILDRSNLFGYSWRMNQVPGLSRLAEIKPRFRSAHGVAFAVIAALLAAQSAQAASSTWTGTAATGNWTDATWSAGVPGGASGSTTSTDVATFANSGTAVTTITVDNGRNVGGVNFTGTISGADSSYTLAGIGSNLVLSSGGVIQSTATGTETIGTSTLTLEGNASILSNAASTTNLVQITSGTLTEASGVTGTLTLGGTNSGANYISSVIANGASSGTLSLLKTGAGTWNVEGNTTYTGATTVAAGTLEVDTANGTLGGTSSVTVQGGASLFAGATSTSSGLANRINTGASMTLGGAYFSGAGTTSLNGTYDIILGPTTANSQSLNSLVIAGGTSDLVQGSGTLGSGTVPTLTFSGSNPYVHNQGGFVDLNASSTTETITFTNNPTGSNGNNTPSSSNLLVGAYLDANSFILAQSGTLTGASYETTTAGGNTPSNYAGANMDVTSSPTMTGTVSINSLRFNASGANVVTLTGTNTIGAAGILVGSGASGSSTISGGDIETSSAGGELLVYLNGKNLTINSSILDDSTSSLSVGALTGNTGVLTLTGANTYAGTTMIASGAALTLGNGTANTTMGGGSIVNELGSKLTVDLANGGAIADNITSDGAISFTPGSGVTQTLSGTISDGGSNRSSITQTTAGTTDLTGAGASTVGFGGVAVTSGTLNISGGGVQSTSGVLNIGSGATVNISSGTNTFNGSSSLNGLFVLGVEGAGTLNISGGTSTFLGTAATLTATTITQTSGTATFGQAGTTFGGLNYTISGSNSVLSVLGGMRQIGTFVVNGGTVTFNNDGGANGGRLGGNVLNNSLTINGGQVNWEGANLNLNYNGTTGVISLNGGTLTMDDPFITTGTATGATINFNGGTLQAGLSSASFMPATAAQTADVQAGGAIIDTNGFNITIALALTTGTTGLDGGLTKLGSGTLTLSGANTYTGTTTISAGEILLGTGGTLGATTADLLDNATLDLGGTSQTVGTLFGSGTILDSVTGTKTLTVGSDNGTGTFTGVIEDNGGSGGRVAFTKTGTGTQVLAGANTYTGTTTISGGTLQLGNGGTSGSLSTSSVIVDNGTFAVDQSDSVVQGTTFSTVVLSGTGGFTQAGTGTTTLNLLNTYSGTTTVAQGAILFNTGASSSSAPQNLGEGAVVDLGAAGTSSGELIYTGGTGTLAKNIVALGNGSDTVDNAGSGLLTLSGSIVKNGTKLTLKGDLNVTGTISGASSGSDLIIDTGTTTLSSANTYNGPTYIRDNATLDAAAAGALPTGTRTDVTMDDIGTGSSTLALGASQSISSLTGASSSLVTLSTNTLTIGNSGTGTGTATFAGVISGTNGALTKDGTSTEIFTGANTYTGTTTISGGNLQIGNGGTTGSLSTSSAIADNGTFTINRSNGVSQGTDFNGSAITGSGGLTQAGTGTTTLTTANSYTGTTTVSAGTLQLNSGSTTGSGALNVGAGATLAGTGSSSGTGFSITGSSSTRATVLVGHNTASDLNTTSVMSLSATGASSIGSANLVFNLNTNVAGQSNQLSVGATAIAFNTVGSMNTTMTLNLQGSSIIAAGTDYILVAGTTASGGSGQLGSQYTGLDLGTSVSLGSGITETQILNSNFGGSGSVNLSFGSANSFYGTNSTLFLYQNTHTGQDDIEVEVVPEPGTWALMLAGLGLLIFIQRSRRKNP